MAGDDHERHLQGERNQVPEAAAPGVDDCADVEGVDGDAATTTSSVASSAKTKASGTQRSVQAVSASATRARSPAFADGFVFNAERESASVMKAPA